MNNTKFLNVHPGEILKEEFLEEMKITAYRLAKETNIPESNLSEIINGKRNITASISIKLGKFFELNPNFWLGLQNDYDIRKENHKLEDTIQNMKSYKDFYSESQDTRKTPSVA
jgi:addiction module HigA family antidote